SGSGRDSSGRRGYVRAAATAQHELRREQGHADHDASHDEHHHEESAAVLASQEGEAPQRSESDGGAGHGKIEGEVRGPGFELRRAVQDFFPPYVRLASGTILKPSAALQTRANNTAGLRYHRPCRHDPRA